MSWLSLAWKLFAIFLNENHFSLPFESTSVSFGIFFSLRRVFLVAFFRLYFSLLQNFVFHLFWPLLFLYSFCVFIPFPYHRFLFHFEMFGNFVKGISNKLRSFIAIYCPSNIDFYSHSKLLMLLSSHFSPFAAFFRQPIPCCRAQSSKKKWKSILFVLFALGCCYCYCSLFWYCLFCVVSFSIKMKYIAANKVIVLALVVQRLDIVFD